MLWIIGCTNLVRPTDSFPIESNDVSAATNVISYQNERTPTGNYLRFVKFVCGIF